MIKFEREKNILFAISQNIVLDGYWYEEVIWAEIDDQTHEYIELRWVDEWSNLMQFDTLDAAKFHIKENCGLHKFHQNGTRHEANVS